MKYAHRSGLFIPMNREAWSVSLGTDLDAEPKYAYKVWYYVKAKSLAERIATDQKTEIISTATTAR